MLTSIEPRLTSFGTSFNTDKRAAIVLTAVRICRAVFLPLGKPLQYSADETLDVLLGGKVKLIQRRDGYRISEDALRLCRFVRPMPGVVGIDLGTGSGIVAIALVKEEKAAGMVGLEIQEDLAGLAERNVRLNGLRRCVEIRHGDIRRVEELFDPQEAKLVISNPPYLELGRGRPSPSAEKNIAKHERSCSLQDLVGAADYLLAPGGVFAFCHLVERWEEIEGVLRGFGFGIRRREDVGKLVLVEGVKRREAVIKSSKLGERCRSWYRG
jgi:tRNA1Val (adenine37-N6)-methyltransferase